MNLHEGYHKYGLLWNEEAYVFFVDGKPTWATKFGDISHVNEFMRLTVEIRSEAESPKVVGLDEFSNANGDKNKFKIKSV